MNYSGSLEKVYRLGNCRESYGTRIKGIIQNTLIETGARVMVCKALPHEGE